MPAARRFQWLKTLGLLGAFLLIVNWQNVVGALAGAPEYDATRAGPVTVYGTEWCGYCRKTRYFLDRHDIPYVDLDIERSDTARAAFDRLGGRGVPVVTVGDAVVHGHNLRRLRAALACADCPAGASD